MKVSKEELKKAFLQAECIVTEKLEREMPETDDRVEKQDWQILYEKGLEQKKKNEAWANSRKKLKIAMILVLATVGSLTFSLSTEAGRRVIMQWFTEWGDKNDTFHFAGDQEKMNSQPPQEIEKIFVPSWIPEGFELAEKEITHRLFVIQKYRKGKHYIYFQQYSVNVGIVIDSENMDREKILINGNQGQINYKNGETILVWTTHNYVFSISSDLGKDDVLKIAESVKSRD